MNETLITDLVAQQALDQLDELDRKMEGTLTQFQDCARELARGIKIPVEVTGDLERLRELANTTMQRAGQAAQQYTQQLQQQQQVIANTTNTISRQLMEQERLNKAQREAFTQQQQALDIADRILGSHEQNVRALARYTKQLEQLKAERKAGTVTSEEYIRRELELKTAKQELQRILTNEQKMNQAAAGSYQQLSLQLERLKQAQKQLNEEEKRGADGQALEKEIQQLDAHLKDLAADMGEFQRNVGNYAVAAQNMKGTLRELTEEIAQLTLQYNELSDEEQRSDVGMQMRDKITQLTEEAGKYKDIVSDVKQSISASASDTRLFDSLIEAGQVFAATMGVAETACRALGMSEDSLQQSMLKVQQAMQAVQALQVIQNTLQKQSNLMKGIAILQSKAAAAAAKMEAAATASATGATKAQTIAQAAFNAVAKANPYVLLATAILAVIGLIVGYTEATKDATAADEEAAEKAMTLKDVREEMADTFAQNAGTLLAKYKMLQDGWNELKTDMEKTEFLKQNQKDFNDLAKEADYAQGTIGNVNTAEDFLNKATSTVTAAILKRARAMAAYQEIIKLTQMELAELEKLSTVYYTPAKAGTKVPDLPQADKDFIQRNHSVSADGSGSNPYADYQAGWSSAWVLNEAGAEALNRERIRRAREQNAKDIEEVKKKYANLRRPSEEMLEANGGVTSAADFRGGGRTGGGSRGGSNGGSGKSTPQVKEYQEIQDEVNKILLDSLKGREDLVEEYSEKWVQLAKETAEQQETVELAANQKRYDKLLAELEASHKAKKMTDEQYEAEKANLEQAFDAINKNIADQRLQREKDIDKAVLEHKQELANKEVEKIADTAAAAQVIRDKDYQDDVTKLYNEYTEALKVAQKKGQDTTKVTEIYNKKKEELDNKYANETVQAQIDAITKELAIENLSEEEREELQRQLTEATTQLAQQRAEQEKKSIEDVVKADEEARKKRQQNLQEWVQKAGEAVQKIGEFISAMYDSQISKIEELLEAEQLRYEQEVEHIDYLAERGAITTEEAEIRKRDAEAATAAKQEQLEKKKAAIEYKKAVMEKANSIAQIGIATALGIMQALAMWPPNIPLAAFVGAMGAIQVATALAQPIKAYAEGTKGKKHPGGLALVGDGNKAEVVMYDGKAWVTPDSPTLVDLPKGAEVLPDAEKASIMGAVANIPRDRVTGAPIIINDYSALESRVAGNTKAVTRELRGFRTDMARRLKRQKFDAYIARRI